MKKAKAKTAKTAAQPAKSADATARVAALVAAIHDLTDALAHNTKEMTRLSVAIEAGDLPAEPARNPEPAASEQ